jgi:predicted amidohydrolase
MANKIRAAVVQLNSTADKSRNLEIAQQLVSQAAAAGAELVVLPELFNCLGPFPVILQQAETRDGRTSTLMSQLAKQFGLHLCAGSICERTEDPHRGFNTSIFYGPDGIALAKYRKIHLFDVDLPGQVQICESSAMLAGDQVVTCEAFGRTIGFATCYDLRFPELFRQLSSQNVELICFPSAFTKVTGAAHWHALLRARAIENQCYVLASNQVGKHTKQLESYGHSMIIDPWGNVIAELATESAAIAVAEIDFQQLVKVREILPALLHRKNFL